MDTGCGNQMRITCLDVQRGAVHDGGFRRRQCREVAPGSGGGENARTAAKHAVHLGRDPAAQGDVGRVTGQEGDNVAPPGPAQQREIPQNVQHLVPDKLVAYGNGSVVQDRRRRGSTMAFWRLPP